MYFFTLGPNQINQIKKLYFSSNFKKRASTNANIFEGKAKTKRKKMTKVIRKK